MELIAASIDGSKSSATSALHGYLAWCKKHRMRISPRQLQLALTDTSSKVFIKRGAKLHVLWLFLVTEQTFSCLVEALGDMFESVRSTVFGSTKFFFNRDEVEKQGNGSEIDQPSKKARALRLTNTDPAKTPVKR
jgi:hypothetical protein